MRDFPTTRSVMLLCGILLLSGCNGDNSEDNGDEISGNPPAEQSSYSLLTDPFLQLPTHNSVNVVWFTSFEGQEHRLDYGNDITVPAQTVRLDRMMEDAASQRDGVTYEGVTERAVFRHEATATGLAAGERLDYRVTSVDPDGREVTSDIYTLAAAPSPNQPLKILLTSDMQSKVNAPANYQRVVDTVGVPDAVFFAGDFVNVPDRASEWFDQAKEGAPAFFPSLQGRAQQLMPDAPYAGGEILQHAPLFGAIGNHEVMGRYLPEAEGYTLNGAYNDPQPRWYAEIAYEEVREGVNPGDDPEVKASWIADQSHNQQSFLDIFSFPDDGPGNEEYYTASFGDVFLISMNVSRIWRSWSVNGENRSKFVEPLGDLENPQAWGFGEFMFERFDKNSEQFQWLSEVVQSDAFQQARYKVVMAHQGVFGLGDNTVPVLADPIMQLVEPDGEGGENIVELPFPISPEDWQNEVIPRLPSISEIRYQYPLTNDIWFNDIEPFLVENGVDLVAIGHSHVWNRSKVGDMHYLESSNVGNSYGAYYVDHTGAYQKDVRASYADFWADVNSDEPRWNIENYPPNGDPQDRDMAFPSVFSPMSLESEAYPELPFLATNNLSSFSILDTGTGTVKSYVFDPADREGEVRLFDEFSIDN
ncbi:fibronectin type III domain-containing protein [Marinobacter sp.]|uniref:fibronectin type III domain-containing protein n=1 Tax=Marinobacter sp. TaxID=50741 RepID=UPI002B278CB7|nr:fibronectin type III domain-containing protein [Marinobacter sp.]